MSVIYTSVQQRFNKIFFRGYKDGKRIQSNNASYSPVLYTPTELDSDAKSLYEVPLKSTEFDNITDAKNYIKSYRDVMDIHGNDKFEYDFIHKNFKGEITTSIADLTIIATDIETSVSHMKYADDHLIKIKKK